MAVMFAYVPSTHDGLTIVCEDPFLSDTAETTPLCPRCPGDCAWPGIVDGLCREHAHESKEGQGRS